LPRPGKDSNARPAEAGATQRGAVRGKARRDARDRAEACPAVPAGRRNTKGESFPGHKNTALRSGFFMPSRVWRQRKPERCEAARKGRDPQSRRGLSPKGGPRMRAHGCARKRRRLGGWPRRKRGHEARVHTWALTPILTPFGLFQRCDGMWRDFGIGLQVVTRWNNFKTSSPWYSF